MRIFLILLIMFAFKPVLAEENSVEYIPDEKDNRDCEEILVDDVTDMAFGDQGQPFTGKVKCYYDELKQEIKSERVFLKGIPIGTHHCFRGVFSYSIIYKNGERFKRAGKTLGTDEYFEGYCVTDETGINKCLVEYRDCF